VNLHLQEALSTRGSSQRAVTSLARRDLKVIRGCLVVLVVLASFAAAWAAGGLLAPTAIAVTFALILAPVTRFIERIGIPTGPAAIVTVVATVSILSAGTAALVPEATNWLSQAPRVAQTIERKLRPITRQIAAVERASNQITQVGSPPAVRSVAVSDGFFLTAAKTAPGVIEEAIYITVLTIFLLACRRRYTMQLILLPRTFSSRLRMARICRDVNIRVSGYLFTLSLINVGLALVTAACFYVARIPDALLWGIAFGLLNFVPIIGPTTMIVAAALVGFATADTIAQALAPPLILLALNTIEANLVQPWLVSRRVVVSPIAIFLTIVTLVWMWGPVAAITAVPGLIFFHTVALHMPALRPVGILLASEGVPSAERGLAAVFIGSRYKRLRTLTPQGSSSPPRSA
jgi:predicted PurR-regulated permease PerM